MRCVLRLDSIGSSTLTTPNFIGTGRVKFVVVNSAISRLIIWGVEVVATKATVVEGATVATGAALVVVVLVVLVVLGVLVVLVVLVVLASSCPENA